MEIFADPTYSVILSYTVISDVYRSFIQNKTTFTKYCLPGALKSTEYGTNW